MESTAIARHGTIGGPALASHRSAPSLPTLSARCTSGLHGSLGNGCCMLRLPHSKSTARNVSGEQYKMPVIVTASTGKDGFPVSETRPATLRRLLEQPGIYQAPACYDALSASLVEKAGFDFSFMSVMPAKQCL